MTAKKQKGAPHKNVPGKGEAPSTDPNTQARLSAEKDIDKDFDLSDPDPTDDLDEGELARRDNNAEDAAI